MPKNNITEEEVKKMQERINGLAKKKNHVDIGGFNFPKGQGLKIGNVIDKDNIIIAGWIAKSILTIDGIVHGLNGSNGLMNAHWSSRNKIKELYSKIIQEHLRLNKIRKHIGSVKIEFIGYKSRFSDWDNFSASFKFIGDSLTKNKIIIDDNPNIIKEFIPSQIKCKRNEQKVVIIITDF